MDVLGNKKVFYFGTNGRPRTSAKRSTTYIAGIYHVWIYLCANVMFWGDIWSRFDPYMAEVP